MDANYDMLIEVDKNKQKNKKKNKKKIWIVSVAIMVVLLFAFVYVFMRENTLSNRDFVYSAYNFDTNSSAVYLNGRQIDTLKGEAKVYDNMNGSGCYIQLNKESYCIEDDKLKILENDLQIYKLANHANVALAKDGNSHLYLVSERNVQKITDEPVDYAVISGDGKEYAYNVGKCAYFGNVPGKETKVENVLITYMSEDGELIYGFEYESDVIEQFVSSYEKQEFDEESYYFWNKYKLVMVNKKGEVKAIKDEVAGLLGLNAEGTELMFIADDKTFILENGKNCNEVIDAALRECEIYCRETAEESAYGYRNIVSYKDCVIEQAEKVYLIKGRYKAVEVVSDCNSVLGFSEDLSKLLYLAYYKGTNTLCVTDVRVGARPRVIQEEVDSGVISLDGEDIYYIYYDTEEMQTCIRYVDGNKEPETIFWVPVGDYSHKSLEIVGDEIYANLGSTYYVHKKELILAEGLINDYKYVVDKSKKEEYVVFDGALYKLNKVEIIDASNNVIEKLEKKKLNNEEIIKRIEEIFKVDLPDTVNIMKYEASGKDTVVARVELNESECQSIVEQYEGKQFDMIQFLGDEAQNVVYMPFSNWYDIQVIKYWYQINSKYKDSEVDDNPMDFIFDVRSGTNIFICELENGKIMAVFGRNYDQPVSY